MIDISKVRIVARFELLDALRSRLAAFVLVLYAAGAAIGSYGFIKTIATAEAEARRVLAESSKLPPNAVPEDLVRENAMPLIAGVVDDEGLRDVLLKMDPLSIFYGFMSLQFVALLVLATSSGAMTADRQSGAIRFILFRCDRHSWALGKFLGHASLMALGLAAGGVVAGLVGMIFDPAFESTSWLWLGRTSVRAWIYGLAYLGVFSGLSLAASTTLRARALSLGALLGFGVGHTVVTSRFFTDQAPGLSVLRFVFPGEYKGNLWQAEWFPYLGSVLGLALIGVMWFSLGAWVFDRRDA